MATTKDTAKPSTQTAPAAREVRNAGSPREAGQTTPYAKELGICQTCNHLPRCLFVKAARRPIMFCDEFDNKDATHSVSATGQPHPSGGSTGQGPEPGLCVNCDTRLDCSFREPSTTVQECEEYR